MILDNENRALVIKMQLEKSDRFMSEADAVAGLQLWDLVAKRIYYAVFFAMAGMFVKDGFPVKSHKGAVVVFGQKYVSTGKFDSKWGHFYARLQELREKCDYNLVYVSTEEEMRPLMVDAKNLISEIRKYIQK